MKETIGFWMALTAIIVGITLVAGLIDGDEWKDLLILTLAITIFIGLLSFGGALFLGVI